ncbi:hypothetical protein JQ506_08495 [Shinella sp. PSBB067]|uniref:hypothetical protein n=1 Tax=Shinella sp. PSBB067 TaxID=2715959 RepID=UPI00193C5C87|nr:hypothetical protein [Shinella sp. PSBB067]QRI65002.1 hypothetical protein JQ506_08495 [Shinella sp. PSBB067]
MLESSDIELEDERLRQLDILAGEHGMTPPELLAQYASGSFGFHEAVHTTSIVLDLVDDQLLHHPAIAGNSDWFRLAARASEALFNLYQAMGAAQLATHAHDEGTRPEDLNASNDG